MTSHIMFNNYIFMLASIIHSSLWGSQVNPTCRLSRGCCLLNLSTPLCWCVI